MLCAATSYNYGRNGVLQWKQNPRENFLLLKLLNINSAYGNVNSS